MVIPGRLSELLKVTYLADKANVPTSTSVAAVVVERLFDLICLGMLVAVALGSAVFEVSPQGSHRRPRSGLAILLFLGLIGAPQRVIRWLPIGRRFVTDAVQHARTLLRKPRAAGSWSHHTQRVGLGRIVQRHRRRDLHGRIHPAQRREICSPFSSRSPSVGQSRPYRPAWGPTRRPPFSG